MLYENNWEWFDVTLFDMIEKNGVPDPRFGTKFAIEFTRVLRRGKQTTVLAETDAAQKLSTHSLLGAHGCRKFGELFVEYDICTVGHKHINK